MEDTWFSRDLPALDAAVSLIDEGIDFPEATDIAERSRLDVKDAARALKALKGEYVDLSQETGDPAGWTVSAVTSAARRAVEQWPSPEGLVDALAEAFGSAAEREPDPEKKDRLRQVGSFLGGTGRDVATEVVAKVILRSAGMSLRGRRSRDSPASLPTHTV
jgi:hypothetical protein